MELSLEMPNLAQEFCCKKRQNDDLTCMESASSRPVLESLDVLDMSQIYFDTDETWLHRCPHETDVDLKKWLYQPFEDSPLEPANFGTFTKSEAQKNIDTRTFTRPKKRFVRPSIEKYNEELYGGSDASSNLSSPKGLNDSGIYSNGVSQENDVTPTKTFQFDLTQPVNGSYFDNMIANAPSIDSFQNMSPPSLVNSMCSSTFANLMENSIIKNDPTLREIRDSDFTASVILQQESEPMFQSITESFSSITSDVAEEFLRKSQNETMVVSYKSDRSENASKLDSTFNKSESFHHPAVLPKVDSTIEESENAKTNLSNNLDTSNNHATFLRSSKLKSTFTVADVSNGSIRGLGSTFQRSPKHGSPDVPRIEVDETRIINNSTKIIDTSTKIHESPKRLLSRRESPSMDLNRLSYTVENDRVNSTFDAKATKRNSYTGSTDSAENLDYMSASSGSSNLGSNRMLNLEGLNAIVEMQERSLHIMSTPKPNCNPKKLWENQFISPISGRNSDPELSSSDIDHRPAMAAPLKSPGGGSIQKQKSLSQINVREPLLKHFGFVPGGMGGGNRLQAMAGAVRGSHPNLRTVDSGTRTNLHRPTIVGTSRSNLHTIGPTLKGSYTSLKPISANLPVAPPPLNSTVTLPRATATPPSEPAPRASPPSRETTSRMDTTFAKPQPPKSSGLPRPTSAATGIPRPVSRIPGPRTASRPVPKPSGSQQGRQSKFGGH